MTIDTGLCQSIAASVVKSNLEMLGTFQKGDKPITRGMTILKEDRYLPLLRRAVEGAFDPVVLDKTFSSAKIICDKAKEANLYENPRELLKDEKVIKKFVENSLRGLKEIETTYRNEAKIVYYKAENKIATAESLKKIYDEYHLIFTPQRTSVTALIYAFDPSRSNRLSGKKVEKFPNEGERRVSLEKKFWQKQEKVTLIQSIANQNVKQEAESSKFPCLKIPSEPIFESKKAKDASPAEITEPPPPPPQKASVKRRRVTNILLRMAKEKIDDLRKSKKKKKNYKEESIIKTLASKKKLKTKSVIEELETIFADQSKAISKRYEQFETHQEELRRQRLEEWKKEQNSNRFDLNMLLRVVENYEGPNAEYGLDESDRSSWDDEDEVVVSMHKQVVQSAQTCRPLTRSISVYPGSITRNMKLHQADEFKPVPLDDSALKRLEQIRIATEYTSSAEDRTDDDDFSDEDPFTSN